MYNKEWRPIKGYEGLYEVSNTGEIKSLPRVRKNGKSSYLQKEKLLRQSNTTTGYKKVELVKDGKRKSLKVHRLVAQAFIPNPQNKPQVNHLDGNKINNNVSNLEWATISENVQHGYDTGLNSNKYTLDEEKIIKLYTEGQSLNEVAKIFNCSVGVIQRILKKNNIKTRTTGEARNLYHIEGLDLEKELEHKTYKQLADEIGCSFTLISYYVNKNKK